MLVVVFVVIFVVLFLLLSFSFLLSLLDETAAYCVEKTN